MPANDHAGDDRRVREAGRRWPTSTREKSTSCWLMPPADISAPARMKYGSASSVNESSCANIFCANSGITRPGIGGHADEADQRDRTAGSGRRSASCPSSSASRNQITARARPRGADHDAAADAAAAPPAAGRRRPPPCRSRGSSSAARARASSAGSRPRDTIQPSTISDTREREPRAARSKSRRPARRAAAGRSQRTRCDMCAPRR